MDYRSGIQYSPCPTATYFDIFAEIEKYTVTIDKHEAVAYLTQFDIPCAPVLSMKEISLDPSLRQVAVLSKWNNRCVENI